jgi:hypothetical protein
VSLLLVVCAQPSALLQLVPLLCTVVATSFIEDRDGAAPALAHS